MAKAEATVEELVSTIERGELLEPIDRGEGGQSQPGRRDWAHADRTNRLGPMTSALAPNQLEAITNACRRHRVARLHAFGSVLRPDYQPGESDIDLLVEFQPDAPDVLYKTYFSLLNELRQSLATRIDLVMVDAIRNPYVKSSIEASKREIYAA